MRIAVYKGAIEILLGDITEQSTDAIVNAANNHLWMGSGVAGAIKRKGGMMIEDEAVAQGPVEIGDAVITSGGTLKAKYVIHAVSMGQDLHTDEHKIRTATRSALKLADEKKLSSICFPALGTGVGSFSVFHCANIMIVEAIEFLSAAKSPNVHYIGFVLFDQP